MFIAGQFMLCTASCAMVTPPFCGSTLVTVPAPLCVCDLAFFSDFMSMPFISIPPMPWDCAWASDTAKTDMAARSKAATGRFMTASFLSALKRLLQLLGRPPAEFAPAQQEIGGRDHEHGKQRRRDHAANHRRRNALH